MPWTPEQARKHNKGLSNQSAEKWSRIANSVLSRTGSDAQAIRVANGAVKPSSKAIQQRLARGKS